MASIPSSTSSVPEIPIPLPSHQPSSRFKRLTGAVGALLTRRTSTAPEAPSLAGRAAVPGDDHKMKPAPEDVEAPFDDLVMSEIPLESLYEPPVIPPYQEPQFPEDSEESKGQITTTSSTVAVDDVTDAYFEDTPAAEILPTLHPVRATLNRLFGRAQAAPAATPAAATPAAQAQGPRRLIRIPVRQTLSRIAGRTQAVVGGAVAAMANAGSRAGDAVRSRLPSRIIDPRPNAGYLPEDYEDLSSNETPVDNASLPVPAVPANEPDAL